MALRFTDIWSRVYACRACGEQQPDLGQNACLLCGAFWSLELIPTRGVGAMNNDNWSTEYKERIINDLNEALEANKELRTSLQARRELNDELRAENTGLRQTVRALASALRAIYDGINDEYHPAFREDLLTDQDRTLLVKARTALARMEEVAW